MRLHNCLPVWLNIFFCHSFIIFLLHCDVQYVLVYYSVFSSRLCHFFFSSAIFFSVYDFFFTVLKKYYTHSTNTRQVLDCVFQLLHISSLYFESSSTITYTCSIYAEQSHFISANTRSIRKQGSHVSTEHLCVSSSHLSVRESHNKDYVELCVYACMRLNAANVYGMTIR